MNQTLSIKAKLGKTGDEIRRICVPRPTDFASFKASVFDALELEKRAHYTSDKVRIRYEDEEGDMVSIFNDSDLKEMLCAVAVSDDNLLRLSINAYRSKDNKEDRKSAPKMPMPRCCPAFASGGSANPLQGLLSQLQVGLPDLLANPALRSMAEGIINGNSGLVKVVSNYVCDECDTEIAGDRFTSTTQPNFDLCSKCMLSEAGQKLECVNHFKKISAFEQLLECLSKGGSFEAAFEEKNPVARHCATCDVCSGPVVGSRFKCFECVDYDECETCHKTSDHEHPFFELTDASVRTIPDDVREQYVLERDALTAHKLKAEQEEQKKKKKVEEEEKKKKEAEEQAARRAAAPVKAPAPAPAPAKAPSAFEENLNTLSSMGFGDRKRNIQVLVRNRNKLFEAIQELLSQE